MKLAQFFQTETEQLLEDWLQTALDIAPELEDEDSYALRDHARSILEFISLELVTFRTKDESARKTLEKDHAPASDIGGEHGTTCFQQGLSMLQMVQEFRALRARVT